MVYLLCRAVFIWVSNVILRFLWFCITTLSDRLEKCLAPHEWTNERMNEPTLRAGYVYWIASWLHVLNCFEFWLDKWIILSPLWLARVAYFVPLSIFSSFLFFLQFIAAQKSLQRSIKDKKKPTRKTSRPNSRQTKKAPSRSRKRQLSSSPSPPPRSRKTGTKADKKSTKRRRVSSSSRSMSSRSPSPAQRSSRREGIKISARGGRGRSSIDSSRSSSPVSRSEKNKKPAGRKDPRLAAKFVSCQKLLNEMMKHEDAWPFLEPVDLTEVSIITLSYCRSG